MSVVRRAAGLLLGALAAPLSLAPAHAACEFAVVKQQIDTLLDRDAEKGAKFRYEVKTGADSIAALEALMTADMQKKIDICRFETAEYLTKRGFPPTH